MISSNIAKRYARAFFDIAGEDNQYEKYFGELQSVSSIIGGNKDLKEFLSNPIFDQSDKKVVVGQILGKVDISHMTENFINLLVDKRRIDVLPDIADSYRELMDGTLRKIQVEVKTAFPLKSDLMERLQKSLEVMTGKAVEMAVSEDASLLGGLVVKVGDTYYDGSIKTQLNNIRNLLGEEL
ncbi:MAG: ATP synthase F1 subunit delta [Deltaproteobacteria bacterium]|nr:ATP synthase F1 subunit delta [Deltaproteobacteria bacterium]